MIEILEIRTVPALITVANDNDVVNGTITSIAALIASPGGDGISFREAISAANNTANANNQPDEIQFAVGNAVKTITVVGTPLPDVVDALIINGSYRGEGYENQQIVLDGTGLPTELPGQYGLHFSRTSSLQSGGSRVWGITIDGFRSAGVLIGDVSDVHVGGSGQKQGNTITNNRTGVWIESTNHSTSLNHVVGNLIGTPDLVFSALTSNGGNWTGVMVRGDKAEDNRIGGGQPSERNTIVFSKTWGIEIHNGAKGTVVFNNYIGNMNGESAAPNEGGVWVSNGARNTVIGGPTTVQNGRITTPANVISGNKGEGVYLTGSAEHPRLLGTIVRGNFIGIKLDGVTALPNTGNGIAIESTGSISIGHHDSGGGNIISGNGMRAVSMSGARSVVVHHNYIGYGADGKATVPNGSNGIFKDRGSSGIIIDENKVAKNMSSGILLEGGGAIVSNNEVLYNGAENIVLRGNDIADNTVTNNIVTGATLDGIRVEIGDLNGQSLNLVISGNTVSQSGGSGLVLISGTMLDGPDADAGGIVSNNEFFDNDGDGITVTAGGSHQFTDNLVFGNDGNGILLGDETRYNSVSGGSVTGNGLAGLRVPDSPGAGNTSLGTTYYVNGGLGIDRGGSGVSSDGMPTLTALKIGSKWQVEVELTREPLQEYVVQFFDNGAVDPSGYGEGMTLIGGQSVVTDANGYAKFVYWVSSLNVRATATGTGADGWTSEFSTLGEITEPFNSGGCIGGYVWDDVDGDGTWDGNEGVLTGLLSGVLVYLLDANGAVLSSTVTNVNGDYSFGWGLAAGTYELQFVPPAGGSVTNYPTGKTGTFPIVVNVATPVDVGVYGLTQQSGGGGPGESGGSGGSGGSGS